MIILSNYGLAFEYSVNTKVSMGFGKVCKLIIQFSRTWKVFGRREVFKMVLLKFWIFGWENSKI